MKQTVIKSGKILLEDVPLPKVGSGTIVIKVAYSCISQGTELSGYVNSGKSKVEKITDIVKKNPEKINKAIDKVKSDGLMSVLKKVNNSTKENDSLIPTGYSAAGEVIEISDEIDDISVGDLVACAGAGVANHAEYVNVPRNLVMKLPEGLDCKRAATVTLGGIALQGVRRGNFKLGEFVAVVGLGFLGQLTVQMLAASGCRVIAIDYNEKRKALAQNYGAEMTFNPNTNEKLENEIFHYTNGYGVDGVIFTAATDSNQALSTAFKMCRKKGRVILVGVSGMRIDRNDIYPKELDFLISTSYGPGRYDDSYEFDGNDYPYAYVRWTENRNMEEYLRLIVKNFIHIDELIQKIYPHSESTTAFSELNNNTEKPIVALFKYPEKNHTDLSRNVNIQTKKVSKKLVNVAVVGAGNFAKGTHLPNLKKLSNKYNIYAIVSHNPLNAKDTALKFGANIASTDYDAILKDENVDLVMICTRHNLHSEFSIKALKSGKAVFVEKPMAINQAELDELVKTIRETKLPFMVGFNRRFSPFAKEIKKHTKKRINPLMLSYRMNAGYIPPDAWVHKDGGRIIGEACHIIDLFNYFTESEIESVSSDKINQQTKALSSEDNVSINLKYKDGSVANLIYTAIGNKNFPKESLDVYFDEKIITMRDYVKAAGFGFKFNEINLKQPDKGHLHELIEFHDALVGETKKIPIELNDMVQTTKATFLVNYA
ncbi:MAG: oxidoreductase [Calditrichaeota bacterium]|nr:MAG: oxidoreductase [Calditrichota bacterium]